MHVDVSEHLLAFGADAYAMNNAGETPAMLVERYPEGAKRAAMLKLIQGSSGLLQHTISYSHHQSNFYTNIDCLWDRQKGR